MCIGPNQGIGQATCKLKDDRHAADPVLGLLCKIEHLVMQAWYNMLVDPDSDTEPPQIEMEQSLP